MGASPIDFNILFIHLLLSRPETEYVANGIFKVENQLELLFWRT